MRIILMAALFVLAGAGAAQSERVSPPIYFPKKTECNGYASVLFLGSCKPEPNRGAGVNGRGADNGPSPNHDLPGGPQPGHVPGGDPIAGGDPGGGGGGGTPGCPSCEPTPGCTSCPPGPGGGRGNPGNDKPVGRAGEDPNGKGKGPTGSRGKNH